MTARPPARRRVRLKEVAKAAGLSEGQASAALSGYRGVSDATRERVRKIAADLGYQPSEHARSLSGRGRRTTHRLAVVLNAPTGVDRETGGIAVTPFVSPMLEGIMLRASELDIDVRLVRWPDLASGVIELAARDGADAVVVPSFTGLSVDDVAALRDSGLPFVLLNRHFVTDPTVPTVIADVAGGIVELVSRLTAAGHRRMALLTEVGESSVVADYHRGWQEATTGHGIADSCVATRVSHADRAARDAAIADLLDREPRPTAIVAVDEAAAHQILAQAAARGITVPDQLSVVTFESMIAPYTTPPLSGHDLRLSRIGARGVERIAADWGLVPTGAEGTETIPPRYVDRDSVAPAPTLHSPPTDTIDPNSKD